MKRVIFSILCLSGLGLGGCYEQPRQGSQTAPESLVEVTLSVVPNQQDIFTRVTDENVIADVNLFLVQDESVIKHVYSTSATFSFLCPVGKYTLYVIANHHSDTGELDYTALRTYTILAQSSYDALPMAGVKEIEVSDSGRVTLPPIEVRRMVARINYNIFVSPEVADMEIQSVQAIHLPEIAMPFNDFGNYPNHYTNGNLAINDDASSRMSGEFYMLPNPCGIVPTISGQKDKNGLTAPPTATYLRIRAFRGNKVLDYSVYLGENSTSDFNIRANTAHTYNIHILNDNETDVRVRSYTIETLCRSEVEPENGMYLITSPITLSISLAGKLSDMSLACELELLSGKQEYFDLNGTPNQSYYPMPLTPTTSVYEYAIRYFIPDFKAENGLLKFRLSFYDKYGFVTSREFTFCYARRVQVYTKWYDGIYGNGYGRVTSSDAYKTVQTGTLSSVSYLIYCPEEGCTLVALPDTGRFFAGWYKEHNGLGLLGMEERLHYTPQADRDIIYANFR